MSALFLLASLGVINGLLLGLYLIIRNGVITDTYFGYLLLALSIRIGKSVFFYFENDVDRLILQVGLSACVFIGPFFFLYLKALRFNEDKAQRRDIFLLVSLLCLVVTVGILFPYRIFPEIWNGYVIYGIYAIWIFYVILGLWTAWKMRHSTFSFSKNGTPHYLLAIVLSVLFITLTYQFALFIGLTYIWGALAFSVTFYYLIARAVINKKSIVPAAVNNQPLENGKDILNRINELIETQKLYLNQNLKLDELANQVGTSKHTLSRVLNEEYSHGFSNYIKEYRVNEAKQLIATRPELSLEGIGYEAGFSSKSSFFSAFKKIANCTPASYKRSILTVQS